jgi:hypothetical protein
MSAELARPVTEIHKVAMEEPVRLTLSRLFFTGILPRPWFVIATTLSCHLHQSTFNTTPIRPIVFHRLSRSGGPTRKRARRPLHLVSRTRLQTVAGVNEEAGYLAPSTRAVPAPRFGNAAGSLGLSGRTRRNHPQAQRARLG